MNPVIVIPARLGATRLPNKPLADICGKPMIARVIESGLSANIGPVIVAAGDSEILAPSIAAGAQAVLTDPNLPSGSDRVLAALNQIDPQKKFDIIVNLQGDMPSFDAQYINHALAVLIKYPQCDIATLVSPSEDEAEKQDENLVKAIFANSDGSEDGQCLYFTRANAPWGDGPIYRHVGLYIYRRAALEKFVAAKPTGLEKREKLEQLRALEIGLKIFARIVGEFPKGVDTQEHLELAREHFKQKQ